MLAQTIKFTLAAFMCSLALTACGGAEERQNRYLTKAKQHYAEKNYEKARVEAKNVLQINPKNVDARILMARLEREDGDFRKAFGNFNAALEENPNNVEALLELAKIYFAGKNDEKATEYSQKALAQDSNNTEAKIVLAGIAARTDNASEAEKLAREVLASTPGEASALTILASIYAPTDAEKALTFIETGLAKDPSNIMLKTVKIQVLSSQGDTDSIETVLKELIKDHPERLDFYYRLARGYALKNNLEDAEQVLKDAIHHNPESFDAKIKLIEFARQRLGFDEAVNRLKALIVESPESFELKQSLAQLYVAESKIEDAKRIFETIVASDEQSSNALAAKNSLAKLYLSERNIEATKKLLQEIFIKEPSNGEALVTSARVKLANGQFKDAIADLRTALKSNSESLEALKLLAFAQEQEGSFKLALDNYRRVIALDSNDLDALASGGRLSISHGELENAQLYLERAIALDSSDAKSIQLLTGIYAQQKNWGKSEELANSLMGQEKTKPLAFIIKANIARSQGDWETAIKYYRATMEIEPRIYEAVAGNADYFINQKDFAGAEKFLESHIVKFPELSYAKEMLAKVYLLSNKKELAQKIYSDLIETNPERIGTYQSLAKLYLSEKSNDKAIKLLQKGIEHNKDSIDLMVFLANIYEIDKNFRDAKSLYEHILKVDDKNSVARNNLANTLINHFPNELNNQKALELASPLAESKNPAYLDTLGWIHYNLGNIPQAISFLQAAIQLNNANPEFHYHLGMALNKAGQSDKAKQHLELATKEEKYKYHGFEQANATLNAL